MNNAAMNIHELVFVWTCVFISLVYVLSKEIAGLYGNSCLTFWGTASPFSKTVAPYYTPTSSI